MPEAQGGEGEGQPDSVESDASQQADPSPLRQWAAISLCTVLLVLGLGVRLHGLDDSPMEFHSTRQLHSAIIARSIYLDRTEPVDDVDRTRAHLAASREERLEAPVTENIVATLYQVTGGESLWVAGVWSSVVFVAGGLLLFLILGRFTGVVGQATGLAVYLFLPLGIKAGRSIQPDPLMVTLVVLTALLVLRHDERPSWWRLVAAGSAGGAAVLVKPMALPFVALVFLAHEVHRRGWLGSLRDPQAWCYGVLLVAPVIVSTALGWLPALSGEPDNYFIAHLLREGEFWGKVWTLLSRQIGPAVVVVGLLGMLVGDRGARRLLASLWVAYVIIVVAFNYRIATHSYYHLVLLPILAMGWGLAVGAVPGWIDRHDYGIARLVFYPAWVLGLVAGFFLGLWGTAQARPPRDPIAASRQAGEFLGAGTRVLGVTRSGSRELAYFGGLDSFGDVPGAGDRVLSDLQGREGPDIDQIIKDTGVDYVVVTDVPRLVADGELFVFLNDNYLLVETGPGWGVYDVHRRP